MKSYKSALNCSNKRYRDAVLQYVNAHMDEKITIQELADQVYLSVYHFSREFKKENGVTVKQFVTEIKNKQAEKLLCSTDLKVHEIAELLGYETSRFTNLFKELHGISPTAYRSREADVRKNGQEIQVIEETA